MYRLYSLAKYKAVFAIVVAMVVGLLVSPGLSLAAKGDTCTASASCGSGLSCVNGVCADVFGTDAMTGENNSGSKLVLGQENLQATATKIINVALGLLGIVSVVIILIGGFKWMTAGGNDEQVGEARKWIFSGIIGLAIILSAWAIAKFVLNNLGAATGVKDFEQI